MRATSWNHPLTVFLLCLALAVVSNAVQASGGVYRWVDASGNVHFGEHPPKGVEATMIKKPSKKKRRDSSAENGAESSAAGTTATTGGNTAAGSDSTAAAAAPKFKKNPEYCKRATANLNMLTERARIRQRKANGEVHYLSEKEVEEQKEIAREAIKTHCP